MCCMVTVVTLFLSRKERYAPVKPRDTSTYLGTFQPACPNPLSSTNSRWVPNSPSNSAPTHSHRHTSPSPPSTSAQNYSPVPMLLCSCPSIWSETSTCYWCSTCDLESLPLPFPLHSPGSHTFPLSNNVTVLTAPHKHPPHAVSPDPHALLVFPLSHTNEI